MLPLETLVVPIKNLQTTTMTLQNDLEALFAPEALQNPYSSYERARAHGELVHIPGWNNAFAFSIDAVNAIFKHPHVSADRLGPMSPGWFGTKLMRPMMLFHDAASHLRLRGLVSQAFTPKAIAETRDAIALLTDELLTEHASKGGDFLTNVAVPLPMLVIAQLLGLEDVDRAAFRRWADALAVTLDGAASQAADQAQLERDTSEMMVYFRQAADDMRDKSAPGVLGAMARAEADGERLSSEELLANAALLLAAGFETTTNLIAGALINFSNHPDQWQRLLEHPELAPNATEECLRFSPPVPATGRLATQNLEWRGQTIPQGTSITLMLGAANRDPQKFEQPEIFDITRANASQHVSFASGPHYCLGAPLARLEMQVFLERLALKYPRFTVPQQRLEYRPNFSIRGLTRLTADLS
jgi:cytochrome P450